MTGPRRPHRAVTNMEIDEISLVNKPANQHAAITIAKAYTGDDMADEVETGYFYMDGTPVGEGDELADGDQVQDAEGNAFILDFSEIEDAANEDEPELAEIGKSAFGSAGPRETVQKSLAESLREELSKAVGDAGTRATLSKALQAVEAADQRASQAEEIAKSERNIRLGREYIAKAASYGEIPGVTPDELGPVLMRAEQFLPYADCVVLNKAFEATGGLLFQELGMTGNGTENGEDPMAVAEATVDAQVSKGGEAVSKAAALEAHFASHPDEYDAYVAGLGR